FFISSSSSGGGIHLFISHHPSVFHFTLPRLNRSTWSPDCHCCLPKQKHQNNFKPYPKQTVSRHLDITL
ncbi:hypothetical protein H107_07827, partial [Trichophyton rubrum CBS 202.88]